MRRSVAAGLMVWAGISVSAPAAGDFNPLGRGKGKKPSAAPATPRAGTPKAPAPVASTSAGEKGEKGAGRSELIGRYTALALSRPGEPFPLERLVELYRQRDGSLDSLVTELSVRAEKVGAEQYASLVALAGALRHDAQHDRAIAALERAIAMDGKNAVAFLGLGRLLADRGDRAGARQRFEAALPLVKTDADREQLLRSLVGLALDLGDFDGASRFHQEIVRRAKGSFFARAELGRELLQRGHLGRAEAEYREVVKAAQGDHRALAPALRDLGQTLSKQGKKDEALETLRRGLSAAGAQSGLRREILEAMVEVHRAAGGVTEVVVLLEKEKPDDFERLTLLAGLYEELGRAADALAAYERALKRKDDITTRLRVVHLLEVQGRLDEAVVQQERLIRSAPHDPELVIRLAEVLLSRGDRKRALAELDRLEARAAGNEDVLPILVDFYERIEEPDRAARLLDRLAGPSGRDPRHLVELGDHYHRRGDTKRALEVWGRIKTQVPDRARALHAYGEVLLDHDLAEQALTALEQAAALAPSETKYQKALALALERTGTTATNVERARRLEAARRIWEKLSREGAADPALQREARLHIVTLWGLGNRLSEHARPLERRLAQTPPDLDAGRLLADVYTRLRRPVDAERVLRAVVAGAPGDAEAHLGLERALVAQRKLAEAILVLERVVKIDPRRARDFYRRMSEYSAELYRDDDAIRYASKAVELSPDDAEGHRKLGQMYRRRQDVEHAVVELRRAISKNDRLYPVYFDLAELLLTRGEVDEADRLLRKVVRASPDDDLVGRSARLSLQVNLGRGTPESLERDLLSVALGNPTRPLYRRLLVEVYDNLAFPLVHDAKGRDPARAAAAREELRKIGERAVKPLLDALGDDREAQQRTAIELLSHVSNQGAGPALVAFATGKASGELRTRAMVAAGALSDPNLLPRLRAVIAPEGSVRVDETDTVAVAAAWAVARTRSPRARPLLVEMLSSDAPSVRSLGAMGLGLLSSRADSPALLAMASSAEEQPAVRAAAAFAAAAASGERAVPILSRLADGTNALVRGAGVIGLARVRAPEAERAIASALVDAEPTLRSAAVAAALAFATKEYRSPRDPLPIPEGKVDVRQVLAGLAPEGYTADERARAIVALGPALAEAAVTTVQGAPESARVVADALLSGGDRPAFAPLSDGLENASPDPRAAAEAALAKIAAALVEPYLVLAKHPSAEVRARATRVLARSADPTARSAVVAALQDADPVVQRAAMASLSVLKDPLAREALVGLARGAKEWPLRVRAAEALGLMMSASGTSAEVAVLRTIAERDEVDFVREAAVRALARVPLPEARAALSRSAAKDPEPRVRRLAKTLLEGGTP